MDRETRFSDNVAQLVDVIPSHFCAFSCFLWQLVLTYSADHKRYAHRFCYGFATNRALIARHSVLIELASVASTSVDCLGLKLASVKATEATNRLPTNVRFLPHPIET
jgi:hypothetical protein